MVHTDGTRPSACQLQEMTEFMEYRGPDGLGTWEGDTAGLGITKLRTSSTTGPEPAQLDHLVIVADARLDAKEDLKARLTKHGRLLAPAVTDSILILHAYAAWGTECAKYLRGDFAFGIWDSKAATLFCARDHFGIKPFYYARVENLFLFGNTVSCLRLHAAVSNALNDRAIGDFLLFGLNYDKTTTAFRDIRRLAPAHSLLLSGDDLRINCYWQPPTEERIRFSRDEEYIEHFQELLTSAVADRLPVDRVGILLSGGLDSASVAATAKKISDARNHVPKILSFTVGYDHLISDDEARYASILARYLGIDNQYLALDDIDAFDAWSGVASNFPEPVLSTPAFPKLFRVMATECRSALCGEGADNLMYFQMMPYLKDLARRGEWKRIFKEAIWFGWVRPFPWRGLAIRTRNVWSNAGGRLEMPQWIAPDFAKRMDMAHRWKEYQGLSIPAENHLARPKGHASMLLPQWTNMFEMQDPGVTRCNIEIRYPYLDLKMVDFLLATPVFPWSYRKAILRKAMAGRIPDKILLRPKTPLSADPVVKKVVKEGKAWASRRTLSARTQEFVNPSGMQLFRGKMTSHDLAPFFLNDWLESVG